MEDDSALTPSEEAAFENGGQTDPESGDEVVESGGDEQVTESSGEAAEVTEQKAEVKPEKTVPLAALHQSRMELKETRERISRMEQAYQQLVQKAQQEQQQRQIPNIEEDAIGHFYAKNQQLEENQQRIMQHQQEQQKHVEAQTQEANFRNQVSSIEAQFAQSTPDYSEAAGFLKQSVFKEYEMMGMTPESAAQATENQLRFLIIQAGQAGLNPAQQAYEMAKSRGFKRPAESTAANKIASINKGQAAGKSLSGTSGKGEPTITLEALAEMDADELDKHWHKISKLM